MTMVARKPLNDVGAPRWDGTCPHCERFIAHDCNEVWQSRRERTGQSLPPGYIENTSAFNSSCSYCGKPIGVAVDLSFTESYYVLFGPIKLKESKR